MERIKWLYPGMGVKRWLALLLFGVLCVAVGAAVLLNSPFLSLLEQRLLDLVENLTWNTWVLGAALILTGLLWISLAIRFGIRSLVSAIKPAEDVAKLVDHVYKTRNLQRGPSIVALGGGTGLATMLRGLKEYSSNLTAIVTMADDGGSSGRLRDDFGMLPPGDIRNTIIALADTEPLMEKLFQHRFSAGELGGHSFGNLFIAAMNEITGDFEETVRKVSQVLAVRGKVLPSTLETVRLGAHFADGSLVMGESRIPLQGGKIKEVFLVPKDARALPEALAAIEEADVVVLGPGSLYTSIIPNLLVAPLADALVNTKALRVYVCNVMTQPGETDGLSAGDHVRALFKHVQHKPILDYVLVNQTHISTAEAEKYAAEGAHPVRADLGVLEKLGVAVRQGDFMDKTDLARHDSGRLAAEIMALAAEHAEERPEERVG